MIVPVVADCKPTSACSPIVFSMFGPRWTANVLIIATIVLTWISGRQRRYLHG